MEIGIRQATAEDAPLICSFIRELAEYERLLKDCVATPEMIAATLFAPPRRVFCEIAEVDAMPAGFALWFYSYSTFQARPGIYLEDLYVRPQFRGNGSGKALLVHLARRAVDENCGRFEWSVLDWNAPSIAFYEALGATPVSGWTRYRLDSEALAKLAEK
ncbi:MAG TPA: GNAT family N-acetyltransferase [Rhizomicrobium sp.]|jgi:GNAT superfamily N-acetyltransferase|nr:GNAT family N-acetyltransferase [Rhizomicrobium sp.]